MSDQPAPQETTTSLKRELDSIAAEAYQILDDTIGRSKIVLTSQSGWGDLLELTNVPRFRDRVPTDSIAKLRALHARWLYHFQKLDFAASTRPVWNS